MLFIIFAWVILFVFCPKKICKESVLLSELFSATKHSSTLWDHTFKTSVIFRGEEVRNWPNLPMDSSKKNCQWRGVGVKNREIFCCWFSWKHTDWYLFWCLKLHNWQHFGTYACLIFARTVLHNLLLKMAFILISSFFSIFEDGTWFHDTYIANANLFTIY